LIAAFPRPTRDTGFDEPLSTERNTTLPYPGSQGLVEDTEPDQVISTGKREHVGLAKKIKGEIKVMEGKASSNPRLVNEGREEKYGGS